MAGRGLRLQEYPATWQGTRRWLKATPPAEFAPMNRGLSVRFRLADGSPLVEQEPYRRASGEIQATRRTNESNGADALDSCRSRKGDSSGASGHLPPNVDER